jgi:hypothetical protein
MAHLDAIERVMEHEATRRAIERIAKPDPLTNIGRIILAESPTAIGLLRRELFVELTQSTDTSIVNALRVNNAARERLRSGK